MSEVRDVVRDIGEGAPLLASAPPVGRRVIAVIGIDRYVRWPRLHNAVNDARKIEHTFRELGFETLAPSLFDADATHAAIADLLDTLDHRLTNQDHLVVFFAGHGGTTTRWAGSEPITTGYLIPVDGTAVDDRPASLFELDSLLRRISRLAAPHILVILDACHSGMALTAAATLHRPRGGGGRDPNPRIHAKNSRVVIASALSDEAAQDGGPLPGHSLFTACLVHALAGDMPRIDLGDGRSGVHGSSLGTFVRDNIYRHQPGTHRQTPDVGRFGNDDRGDMPIALGHASEAGAAPPAVFPSGSAPVIRTSKIEIEPDPAFFASHCEIPIASPDEPAPPARRARPVVIGLAAVVAAAACALAWWRPTPPASVVAILDEDDAEIAVAPDRATRANDPPPPVRAAPPRPLSVIRTAAPAVAAAARCYADVFSIPRGAAVFRGDVQLGVAPTHLELPCGTEVTLTFQIAEHNPTVKKVVGTHEGARVSTRLPRTTPRPSAQ